MPRAAVDPIASIPAITIAIPLPSGAVVVHAPAPALVGPRNPDHVGMSWPELRAVLADMRADPAWSGRVVAISRKRVMAAPADVLGYLRAKHAAPPAEHAPPAPGEAPGDSTLRELGIAPRRAPKR